LFPRAPTPVLSLQKGEKRGKYVHEQTSHHQIHKVGLGCRDGEEKDKQAKKEGGVLR
jgi:hypothetical protein